MVDLEKRKRVMQRSISLGHCICDPRKPCPCDVFKEHDVCLCAGERLEPPKGPVRLTEMVEYAGCASKIDQASLKRILSGLPEFTNRNVLVGVAAGDDAGVYRIGKDLALVQTVDVFSPVVDEPYTFGQIAAANSLSDIYAMGAKPLTALSIIGFPVRAAPDEAMREILRGGLDKMREAGVPVIGGHSINDPEIKAGFAVTGTVNPRKMVTNAAARPGDVLVLTKPLGTGLISFAGQIGRAPAGSLEAAASSMAALNRIASELMLKAGAHAVTDVTGFGLAGHLSEMAASSGVDVEVTWDDLPLLPGVVECLAAGIVPGGVERNRESSGAKVKSAPGVTPEMLDVLFDPQTSGGLLVSLPRPKAPHYLKSLEAKGIHAAIIGVVTQKGRGRVLVKTTGARRIPALSNTKGEDMAKSKRDSGCCAPASGQACCARAKDAPEGKGATHEAMRIYGDFARTVSAAGALDARTKNAIGIALSIACRCEQCTKAHISQAVDNGLTEAEIGEAAMMGVLFGGSPSLVLYEKVKDELA
jgi:selenide,water dikinase